MERKLVVGIVLLVAIVAIAAAVRWFVPDATVDLDEQAPNGETIVVRTGMWRDADAAHQASGTIELVTIDGVPYLEFTDFQMTSGPDVYLYLTASPDPRSTQDVEQDGIRVDAITRGDPDAHLNERGSFFVALDMDLDALAAYEGVAAWCDDFNVLFGNASLV